MTPPAAPFPWRSVAIGAYLPTTLFGIGAGAVVPVIPAIAGDLGAGIALTGVIASMPLAGHLLGDLPSGVIVARIGERRAMVAASLIAVLGTVIAFLARDPFVFGAGLLLLGVAESSFRLARHAFLATAVPFRQRARALSTLGGSHRLGIMVGPFVAAAVLAVTGEPTAVLWVPIVAAAASALAVLVIPDPARLTGRSAAGRRTPGSGLGPTLLRERRVLLTLGVGAAILTASRQARQVVLPLWGDTIGLDETTIALVMGIAATVDFSLFYASGWVMDRFGRTWVAAPPLVGLAIGFAVLPLTGSLPAAGAWFTVVAVWLALANGVSSGVLMTLGADLADPANPAPFLGAWRLMSDLGGAGIPLLVSGVTALAGLPIGVAVLAPMALTGALLMRVHIPRHPPRRLETGPIPVPDEEA